ncbi:GerAB/ArcD/ProY family transporter [Bacillus sp. Marseille-P3661]|uniref:GerAB/ArcD/ProY family transporter n=1 Tax=Bacillus sp. Marseille-P3661 TaxID=1936234 RepID=UPI000C840D96|nr:GerAB/ArcD/ProY family transporter [Bacillus sp. Marseille-P3661]
MRVQITNGMFMALIINMVYAKAIGLTQGTMAREVNNDIWISTIMGGIQGAILMLLVVVIINRMPEGDLIKQGEKLIGTWFSKFLGLMFFVFFTAAFITVMATFVYHLKDYFLHEAPTWIFVVVAIVVGGYAVFFGVEVIARMALIGVFSVLSLNILLLLGAIGNFDIRELLPVFDSGVIRTAWASRHFTADWTMTTMMAAIILPLVKDVKTWPRSGTVGVLYGLGFVVMWPIVEVGVLSAEVTAQYIVSCMQMARSAEIGIYIHRYEMIMVAFFALSILTQIMMSLYCASISLQRVFNLQDYRVLVIPVCLVFGGISYWYVSDHARAIGFIEREWVGIGLAIAIGVPLFMWLIGFVFKDKLQKIKAETKAHPGDY